MLERDLVAVLEQAQLLRLHLPDPEVLEDGALRLVVDVPFAVDALGHPRLAAVEGADDLLDAVGRHSAVSSSAAARLQSSMLGTNAKRM